MPEGKLRTGPKCPVCTHALREEIEKDLGRGRKHRNINEEFGLSNNALQRHKKHMVVTATEFNVQSTPMGEIDRLKELAKRELTSDNARIRLAAQKSLQGLHELELRSAPEGGEQSLTEHAAFREFLKRMLLVLCKDCRIQLCRTSPLNPLNLPGSPVSTNSGLRGQAWVEEE